MVKVYNTIFQPEQMVKTVEILFLVDSFSFNFNLLFCFPSPSAFLFTLFLYLAHGQWFFSVLFFLSLPPYPKTDDTNPCCTADWCDTQLQLTNRKARSTDKPCTFSTLNSMTPSAVTIKSNVFHPSRKYWSIPSAVNLRRASIKNTSTKNYDFVWMNCIRDMERVGTGKNDARHGKTVEMFP